MLGLDEKTTIRVFAPPVLALVWLAIMSLWAVMQARWDRATFKTLGFGFVLCTALGYLIFLAHGFFDSPIALAVGLLAVVYGMYLFHRRLKKQGDR